MVDFSVGETIVTLNDQDLVLKPTLRAMNFISRQYGGLAKARQALADENIDTIVFILRIGTGMQDKEARNLDEKVFRNGITTDLIIPLIKYIAILENGGKPLPEDLEGEFKDISERGSSSLSIMDHNSGNG